MTYHSSSLPANTKNSIPEKIRKSIYSDHFGNLWENFNSKTQNNFPNIKTLGFSRLGTARQQEHLKDRMTHRQTKFRKISVFDGSANAFYIN